MSTLISCPYIFPASLMLNWQLKKQRICIYSSSFSREPNQSEVQISIFFFSSFLPLLNNQTDNQEDQCLQTTSLLNHCKSPKQNTKNLITNSRNIFTTKIIITCKLQLTEEKISSNLATAIRCSSSVRGNEPETLTNTDLAKLRIPDPSLPSTLFSFKFPPFRTLSFSCSSNSPPSPDLNDLHGRR